MVRELLAIAVVILLVSFGWKQPFQRHLQHIMGTAPPTTPAPRAIPMAPNGAPIPPNAEAARSDNSWMWKQSQMQKPYNQSGTHVR